MLRSALRRFKSLPENPLISRDFPRAVPGKMLEGAVARMLNQLLGKYVVDLDTENLNVGIFSGHVQLTDLKLKTEALVRKARLPKNPF